MPRSYKRKTTPISEAAITKALDLIKNKGFSKRKAARECGINDKTVGNRLLCNNETRTTGGQLSMPKESEQELAMCLVSVKEKWGFPITKTELISLVKDYVDNNKKCDSELGEYLRKYCKFVNNVPGSDWVNAFLARYNLSWNKKEPKTTPIIDNNNPSSSENINDPEKEYQEDYMDEHSLEFNEGVFKNMKTNLVKNKFYAVDYGRNLYYIGKISKLTKSRIEMKFLKRLRGDMYKWPVQDDIDNVNINQIFAGPINLTGTIPYHIINICKTYKDFKNFLKQKKN